jgi:hypothetical protein
LEAAVIYGFLYYLYGPDELYGYVREAGKFVSKYLPIVRDISFNIFNEIKDFIEEDQQRDDMKKRGIDISRIPRKTSNIFERLSESVGMLSEMSKDSQKRTMDNNENDISLSSLENEMKNSTIMDRQKLRKTKKEILKDKPSLLLLDDSSQNTKSLEAELSDSLQLVQDKFSSFIESKTAQTSSLSTFEELNNYNNNYNNINNINNVNNMVSPFEKFDAGLFPTKFEMINEEDNNNNGE